MLFIFTHENKRYTFDDEKLSLGEARWVKQNTGLVGAAFFEAAQKLDPDAILALLVLAMRRAGKTDVTMNDFDMEDEEGYINLIKGMDVAQSPSEKKARVQKG